jgi:hypothetical protein
LKEVNAIGAENQEASGKEHYATEVLGNPIALPSVTQLVNTRLACTLLSVPFLFWVPDLYSFLSS